MKTKRLFIVFATVILSLPACSTKAGPDKGYYHDLPIELGARSRTAVINSNDGLITFTDTESPLDAYGKFVEHFGEFEMNNYDFVTYRSSYNKSPVSSSGFTSQVGNGVYIKNNLKSASTSLLTESFSSCEISCSSIELGENDKWINCSEYEDGVETKNYGTDERFPSSSELDFYNESNLLITESKPELRFPSDPASYVFSFEFPDEGIVENYDLNQYNSIQFAIYQNYIMFSFATSIGISPIFFNVERENVRHAYILNALHYYGYYYCVQEMYLNTLTGEVDKVSVQYNGRDLFLMIAFDITYEIQLRRNSVDASNDVDALIEKCKSYSL